MTPEGLVTQGTVPANGVAAWMAYIWSLMAQVFAHLFQIPAERDALFSWDKVEKQWEVTMCQPAMTEKGADIVGAVMTIVHNGLIFVAQLSTLLPYDAIPVGIPT